VSDETAGGSKSPFSVRTLVCCLAAAGFVFALAMIIGISDNPPGLALLVLSALLLVAAFVHNWRRPRPFIKLAVFSLLGFPVFVILHNAFYAFGELSKDLPLLPGLFEALHVAGFMIALIVCPAGLIVGLIGAAVTWLRGRMDKGDDPPPTQKQDADQRR